MTETLGTHTLKHRLIRESDLGDVAFQAVETGPEISGDNTYIAWWTNKTGNDEVMFRASNDNGQTFADKINLSNSTDADSQDVRIAAEGDNVIITWWERNQTAEEPVEVISTDNGATFGPLLRLATNGTRTAREKAAD